jgi:hypothetical protein
MQGQAREGYVAEPIQSEGLDRRQLLTSAADVVAAGILPGSDQAQAVNPTKAVCSDKHRNGKVLY